MNNNLYIVWMDEDNTGINIVDEQHRGIISTINSLHYFIQNGHGNEVIRPTILSLDQYIKIHFDTEEELMNKADYPEIQEHISLHRAWTSKAQAVFKESYEYKDPCLLLRFLKNWWLNHIKEEDSKYIHHMKSLIDTDFGESDN